MTGADSPGFAPTAGVLVFDACSIINLRHLRVLEHVSALPDRACLVPRTVVREVKSPTRGQDVFQTLINAGRIVVVDDPLTFDELVLLVSLPRGLSESDRTVLIYALRHEAGVATDDRSLAHQARRHRIRPVMDTLDLLEETVSAKRISLTQANMRLHERARTFHHSSIPCLCDRFSQPCHCNKTPNW